MRRFCEIVRILFLWHIIGVVVGFFRTRTSSRQQGTRRRCCARKCNCEKFRIPVKKTRRNRSFDDLLQQRAKKVSSVKSAATSANLQKLVPPWHPPLRPRPRSYHSKPATILILVYFDRSCDKYTILESIMVKTVVELLSKTFSDVVDFFPAGILLSLAAGCVADQKYFKAWKDELIGSMLMICFTFSAGKWIGKESWEVAWAWHVVGVILADKVRTSEE